MRNSPILICCLLFMGLLTHAQDNQWIKIDKNIENAIGNGQLSEAKIVAESHLQEAKNIGADSLIAKFYFSIALGHYREDIQLGLIYLDSALALSKSIGFHSMYTRASNAKSTFYKRLGLFTESKKISLQVFKYAVDNSPTNIFISARNLSIVYREIDQYDSALYYIFIADSLAASSQDQHLKFLATQGMANIYEKMGKFRLSISKNLTLLKFSESSPDLMYTWLNLGAAYQGLDLIDSSNISFRNSLSFAREMKDTIEMANLHGLIANNHLKKTEFEQALENVNKSLSLASVDNPEDIISSSYITLSEIQLAKGQYVKAIESSRKALALSQELSLPVREIDALDILSQSLNESGKSSEAYEVARQFEKKKSELANKNRTAKIEELQAQYESEKQVQEIGSLKRKNQIKDLQISRQQIMLISAILLALLVLILAYVIYRQNKLKTLQRQLALEQTLLRTQMNPHFIFNAMSSIQNFMLDNDGPKASLYLAKFGELMRDILESSREEMIPLSWELKMLTNYTDLEKVRSNQPLEIDFNTNDLDPEAVLIPPMLIQPFIENSLKHGFTNKESGAIQLRVSQEKDLLKIVLEDNGKGIDANYQTNKKSLAIKITQERLSMFRNAPDNSIEISNKLDQNENIIGLIVTLQIPLKYAF